MPLELAADEPCRRKDCRNRSPRVALGGADGPGRDKWRTGGGDAGRRRRLPLQAHVENAFCRCEHHVE